MLFPFEKLKSVPLSPRIPLDLVTLYIIVKTFITFCTSGGKRSRCSSDEKFQKSLSSEIITILYHRKASKIFLYQLACIRVHKTVDTANQKVTDESCFPSAYIQIGFLPNYYGGILVVIQLHRKHDLDHKRTSFW